MANSQDLPDLVIFKGILNATFVGSEYLLVWNCGGLGFAGGLRIANHFIAGADRFRVCHSSSPNPDVEVRARNDHALTAWPACAQHALPARECFARNQRLVPTAVRASRNARRFVRLYKESGLANKRFVS
jgi:hypothetical protein